MKWKIGVPIVCVILAYLFFGPPGTGKIATINSGSVLKEHIQGPFTEKLYPSRESLGTNTDEHEEFMKREHPNLMRETEASPKIIKETEIVPPLPSHKLSEDKVTALVEADIDMAYEVDSQPVEVMSHLSTTAGEILKHIQLWYGGGIDKYQIRSIVEGDPVDVGFNVRITVFSLDKDHLCLHNVHEHEISINSLMDSKEMIEFVRVSCPEIYNKAFKNG